jgi:hypothetical protein
MTSWACPMPRANSASSVASRMVRPRKKMGVPLTFTGCSRYPANEAPSQSADMNTTRAEWGA